MSEYVDKTTHTPEDRVHALVLAVYRVTEKLPETEPLRWKMREEALKAIQVAQQSKDEQVLFSEGSIPFGALQAYFKIARAQKWIDDRNFVVLASEFERFAKHQLQPETDEPRAQVPGFAPTPQMNLSTEAPSSDQTTAQAEQTQLPKRPVKKKVKTLVVKLSGRQEKIVDHLKQNGKVHVGDLSPLFPTLSKRTIRRDLDSLVKEHFVTRFGKTNGTLYSLVRT